MAEKKPTKLTRVEQKEYLPSEDPLLPQFFAAIITAGWLKTALTYDEMMDQAFLALAAFRKATA